MIDGVSWVGMETQRFAEACRFFEEVFGLRRRSAAVDFAELECPNGDLVEIFGPRSGHPAYQFARSPVVVGFSVDDIESARRRLERSGVTLLGDVVRDPEGGAAWQHFRGPDGLVFELNQYGGR
jgi:predicted enzyme related to lactoylglutathione lyase